MEDLFSYLNEKHSTDKEELKKSDSFEAILTPIKSVSKQTENEEIKELTKSPFTKSGELKSCLSPIIRSRIKQHPIPQDLSGSPLHQVRIKSIHIRQIKGMHAEIKKKIKL